MDFLCRTLGQRVWKVFSRSFGMMSVHVFRVRMRALTLHRPKYALIEVRSLLVLGIGYVWLGIYYFRYKYNIYICGVCVGSALRTSDVSRVAACVRESRDFIVPFFQRMDKKYTHDFLPRCLVFRIEKRLEIACFSLLVLRPNVESDEIYDASVSFKMWKYFFSAFVPAFFDCFRLLSTARCRKPHHNSSLSARAPILLPVIQSDKTYTHHMYISFQIRIINIILSR